MNQPAPLSTDVLALARDGDKSARSALLERYGPVVWSMARRLTPEPEDAYQEVWLKVFAALHRFDPYGSASFSTWVATVAHRHLIDRYRKTETRGVVVSLDRLGTAESQADAHLDQRRRLVRTEEALRTLPAHARRVVIAHCLHGVALKDIAADEGVAVGTIKARLHRARAELVEKVGR
ncbi:MAG: sigma-70 family RNA polymerase sigma factor [Proteobacteria bacterium]|nr:sigma-70 family RNA polymerase sigma factor [Pseudomonadota bacterium]